MAEQVSSLKTGIKYKDTPIGKIPVDWEVVRLEDVSEINMGQSPPSEDCSEEAKGLPFYQGNAQFGSKYPSPKKWCEKPKKIANQGDILISVRAPVGEINIAPHKCCIGRGLAAITAKGVNPDYLYHSLFIHRKALQKIAQGSTFEAINSKELSDLSIFSPPFSEQKQVAEILTTVDEAIEKTAQVIETTKEVKKGLMQKLLTRGIGHKKYKKTEIGEIPEEWEVKNIGEICEILDNKRIPLNKEQRDKMRGEIPYYGANGVIDYINDYIFEDDLILMAEDGGYFEEYSTRPIAYLIHGKSWVNNHAHVLKVKEPNDTFWVYYSLAHKNIIPFIKGGTRSKLNQEELKQIIVLIPSFTEQKEIAEILSSIDEELEKESNHKEHLELLKKGLMQVLLTGKIRVSV
jgi:type I restriction enzyme S subunit